MAPTGSKWRLDRPTEGFDAMPPCPPSAPMVHRFLPDGYEPRYAYPLLVLFHPHGGNETAVLDLVPRISRRNFVAVSLRGPDLLGVREDGQLSCGWGRDDAYADLVSEQVWKAVEETRRACHIHSERVYLVGIGEGAAAAYRTAFALSDRIGGVVALNGSMPRPSPGRPVFRLPAVRGMSVFIGHGVANPYVPIAHARRDHHLLYAAGADVTMRTYTASGRLSQDMLGDVNRWVVGALNAETDRLAKIG